MTQANLIPATKLLKTLTASALPNCTLGFTDEYDRTLPGSVTAMKAVTLGDLPQRLWFRGSSREE